MNLQNNILFLQNRLSVGFQNNHEIMVGWIHGNDTVSTMREYFSNNFDRV